MVATDTTDKKFRISEKLLPSFCGRFHTQEIIGSEESESVVSVSLLVAVTDASLLYPSPDVLQSSWHAP
jgi:hypothetical protein